jgi:hypothetical protein
MNSIAASGTFTSKQVSTTPGSLQPCFDDTQRICGPRRHVDVVCISAHILRSSLAQILYAVASLSSETVHVAMQTDQQAP